VIKLRGRKGKSCCFAVCEGRFADTETVLSKKKIHSLVKAGEQQIVLDNVNGQRHIDCGLKQPVQLVVNGVPGSGPGCFCGRPTIEAMQVSGWRPYEILPEEISGNYHRGNSRRFLREYMAGGILILLALDDKERHIVGNYLSTGRHRGTIYIRGEIKQHQLGREVAPAKLEADDQERLQRYLAEYCQEFGINLGELLNKEFIKLISHSHRPYGGIYAY